jgi:uncharacterized protein YdhG (YjbR/CyaY superfamily)
MYGKRATPPIEPEEWLANLDDVRRPQLEALDAQIRRVAPGLRRYVDHGFLSYGRYAYRSRAGRTGEWMCIALASNKQYISIYVGPGGAEPFADRLPKASLGKGCIRFKRLDDVDPDVIDDVIRDSAAADGTTITYGAS